MINRLLYDQALVRPSISSLFTLHLSIYSPVILDKLQVTESAEAGHKAEMGVLSFLPLDTVTSSWLTSIHPAGLSTGLFSKAFLQSSGSATPGLCFHITVCTLLFQCQTFHTGVSYLSVFYPRVLGLPW